MQAPGYFVLCINLFHLGDKTYPPIAYLEFIREVKSASRWTRRGSFVDGRPSTDEASPMGKIHPFNNIVEHPLALPGCANKYNFFRL